MTDQIAETTTEATPKAQRRRRASTGGHAMKLDAPARKGFVRRWVLDDPARIAELHSLGYDFAEQKSGEGAARTDGLGTRITRHAGKGASGAAQQLVLMETPEAEYAKGAAEKAARAEATDDAIRRGVDTTGQLATYQPSAGSNITHSR